jgi:hypothetical protein
VVTDSFYYYNIVIIASCVRFGSARFPLLIVRPSPKLKTEGTVLYLSLFSPKVDVSSIFKVQGTAGSRRSTAVHSVVVVVVIVVIVLRSSRGPRKTD